MCLEHYVQWRWLLFFGLLFWLCLVGTDEFYRKYLDRQLIERYIEEDWFSDTLDIEPKTSVIEPVKVEEILLEKANKPIIDTSNIWHAIVAFSLFSIIVLIKFGTNGWSELIPQISPEEHVITIDTRPGLDRPPEDPLFAEDSEATFDEVFQKSRVTPANSRPSSRSMKSPSIDVKAVQAKLENLQKIVTAMRDRHAIPPGIVSTNKNFQKFLSDLKAPEPEPAEPGPEPTQIAV